MNPQPEKQAAVVPVPGPRKVRVHHLQGLRERGEPVVMVTAYDYPTAQLADASGAELVLVGDSLGNVVLGLETTLEVTLDMMIHHTRAARRGVRRALLVADMPFLSYQISPEEALRNAARLMAEGGAEAVKLEGSSPSVVAAVRRLVEAGIPVMGHVGLTPQSVHTLGGYRIQGKTHDAERALVEGASALERAGAFAIVLELAAPGVAQAVRTAVRIPVIGIGAGPDCDGQVLVWHDLLGMRPDTPPSFVRQFSNLWDAALDGLKTYTADVKARRFPGPKA